MKPRPPRYAFAGQGQNAELGLCHCGRHAARTGGGRIGCATLREAGLYHCRRREPRSVKGGRVTCARRSRARTCEANKSRARQIRGLQEEPWGVPARPRSAPPRPAPPLSPGGCREPCLSTWCAFLRHRNPACYRSAPRDEVRRLEPGPCPRLPPLVSAQEILARRWVAGSPALRPDLWECPDRLVLPVRRLGGGLLLPTPNFNCS